jgi:hypothetical protein
MRLLITSIALIMMMTSCGTLEVFNGQTIPVPCSNLIPGYTGRIGCGCPVNESQFMQTYNMLQGYSNSITREEMAKKLIPRQCYSTAQVRRLAGLWTNEITREDILYYTYPYTHDIDNYINLQNMFQNSITRQDFAEWCLSH